MILPDVNVLIYASRRDSPHHEVSRAWLYRTMRAGTPLVLSSSTLAAFVRVTTNRRAFSAPSELHEALAFCEDLRSYGKYRQVEPAERHWSIFSRLCSETGITGGDVTDVWYAALAIESGCDWASFDQGFRRFSGLSWIVPQA